MLQDCGQRSSIWFRAVISQGGAERGRLCECRAPLERCTRCEQRARCQSSQRRDKKTPARWSVRAGQARQAQVLAKAGGEGIPALQQSFPCPGNQHSRTRAGVEKTENRMQSQSIAFCAMFKCRNCGGLRGGNDWPGTRLVPERIHLTAALPAVGGERVRQWVLHADDSFHHTDLFVIQTQH